MNATPRFLAVEDVLTLHLIAIEDQGGDPSVRDRTLLESAVAAPRQQFGKRFLHEDIPAMAAAYAFHICQNHPFVDGNKRAAVAAMIAFLSDNGWAFDAAVDVAEPVILALASGTLDKAAFTAVVRKFMREKPRMELREFMIRLSGERMWAVMDSMLASGSKVEIDATTVDAARAIPVISEFLAEADIAKQQGNEARMSSLYKSTILLVSMYRIAEDMGYEW